AGLSSERFQRLDAGKWNDVAPSTPGGVGNSNPSSGVICQTHFNDGNGDALYVGGYFGSAGALRVSNVAKWDGVRWSALGDGVGPAVYALRIFDDGEGPALYAAGSFTEAGGKPVRCIARWDGHDWWPLGTGIGTDSNEYVLALHVFDDGSGPSLYAGGQFATAG